MSSSTLSSIAWIPLPTLFLFRRYRLVFHTSDPSFTPFVHLSLAVVADVVEYCHSLFRGLVVNPVFLRRCLTGVLFRTPLLAKSFLAHRLLKKTSVGISYLLLPICLPSSIAASVCGVSPSNARLTNEVSLRPPFTPMCRRV